MKADHLSSDKGATRDRTTRPAPGAPDPDSLEARISVLEVELRSRMQEIAQLARELRSAKADLRVKDEFIEALHLERLRGPAPPLSLMLKPNGVRKFVAWIAGPRITDRLSSHGKRA